MTEEKTKDSIDILDDIDNLEDFVERLAVSNEVTYDENFHKVIINMYVKLLAKIKKSHLSEDDKGFMSEVIVEIFDEYS